MRKQTDKKKYVLKFTAQIVADILIVVGSGISFNNCTQYLKKNFIYKTLLNSTLYVCIQCHSLVNRIPVNTRGGVHYTQTKRLAYAKYKQFE